MSLFSKKIIQQDDPELIDALQKFVGAFEVVFRHDWEYTKIMIGDEEKGCNFIEPGLEDETEDWGARGALLESYRHLLKLMSQREIEPILPFPISDFLKLNK